MPSASVGRIAPDLFPKNPDPPPVPRFDERNPSLPGIARKWPQMVYSRFPGKDSDSFLGITSSAEATCAKLAIPDDRESTFPVSGHLHIQNRLIRFFNQ